MGEKQALTDEEVMEMAYACGFEHVSKLNVPALRFEQAVRDMCKNGHCGSYGKNWCCPPACGTLDEAAEQASRYHRGIIVQSTGEMEDDFDVETMMDTEQIQKDRFYALVERIREVYPDCLPMSSGTCTLCGKCAYPEPCRFPTRRIPSMEAYGLNVSQVCMQSDTKYYYGRGTITYTACVLLD